MHHLTSGLIPCYTFIQRDAGFTLYEGLDVNMSENHTHVLREQAHLLDLMLDAIILRDMRGAIIFWNHGAEKLLGWTRDEALGKHAHTLLHTQFPQPLEAIEAEALRAGQWEGELIHTRRDGTPVVVTSRWAVWQQDHGDPLAIVEINRSNFNEAIRLDTKNVDAYVCRGMTCSPPVPTLAQLVRELRGQ